MTPDEAKTKWCPFARVGTDYNRLTTGKPDSCNCVADGCMVWRWERNSTTDGFCGLATDPLSTVTQS